jgi:hypothetical protein
MGSTGTTTKPGWTKPSGGAKYAGEVSVKQIRGWFKKGLRHVRLENGRILTKYDWIDEFLGQFEVKDDLSRLVDELLND